MSKQIIKNINELLNEEKWTRISINEYTISDFEDFEKLVAQAIDTTEVRVVVEACEKHLETNKESIIALYIAGILAIKKRSIDDSNIADLINRFVEIEKYSLVEHLCNTVLSYGENKFALRTLADNYTNSKEINKKLLIWDRILKTDFTEAEIAKNLAEHYEENNDRNLALLYYKKALHRFINKAQFNQIKQIWEKLLDYDQENINSLLQMEQKIAKSFSAERTVILLELLYAVYRNKNDFEGSIAVLKKILNHDPRNSSAKSELIACYMELHANHTHLEEYLSISSIKHSNQNIHDAIAKFEKYIGFDEGSYVFHRSWGLGKIKTIDGDTFTIDFLKKRNHTMSQKMAVNALFILSSDHIWVLRASIKKEILNKKIKEEPIWALKTIIKSFNNLADMKRIKTELSPKLLSTSEWTKWSTNARKILKTNSSFTNPSGNADKYSVVESPVTFEEKTFNKFKSEKNFYKRIETFLEFLDLVDSNSEYFHGMVEYFENFIKTDTAQVDNRIASFVVLVRAKSLHPYLQIEININFTDIYDRISDIDNVFEKLDNVGLTKEFLEAIKNNIENWPKIFARFFLFSPSKQLFDELFLLSDKVIISDLIQTVHEDYRLYRAAFVWLGRNCSNSEILNTAKITVEKPMIGMIHLYDITLRDIENKRELSLNRKLNRHIYEYLFKEDKLIEFIKQSSEESITRIYPLIEDIESLDPSLKIKIRQRIIEKHPSFKLDESQLITAKVSNGILVTPKGYESRQKDLRTILENEIPDNSKEIGIALQKGDLRENAEYKAALERQEMLKNSVSKLQSDLQNAQVFNLDEISSSKISFGTTVELTNLKNKTKEVYTILGPWESNPDNHIISYLSPLGAELWHHKSNEELRFTINNMEFHYRVEKISKFESNSESSQL